MSEKMNYEEFKATVVEQFPNYLQDTSKRFEVHTVYKNNLAEDKMIEISSEPGVLQPAMSLKTAYACYIQEYAFEELLKGMAGVYEKACEETPDFDASCFTEEYLREHVVFHLVGWKNNQEMLSNMPHRRFLDMAVVYYLQIHETLQAPLNYNVLSMFGEISEEELFRLAYKNTYEHNKIEVFHMGAMMGITNSIKFYGAANMLYTDVIDDLAETVEDDTELYILPSSVHEFLLHPDDKENEQMLASMIKEINATEVAEKDVLTDSLYRYDRVQKQIVLVRSADDHI